MVKLALQLRADGMASLEAFHDMVHTFFIIAQFRPEELCRSDDRSCLVSEQFMNVLVDVSMGSGGERSPAAYAKAIVQTLMRDPKCEAQLLPIIKRAEGDGITPDTEDVLKSRVYNGLTPTMYQ